MTNRPLVYHWIAYYEDGSILPQYNIDTYKKNIFTDIEQNKLIKFGLYPFTKDLSNNIQDETFPLPFLPVYEINLDKNKRLIHYRDVFISQESYHLCRKCNKEFKYIPGVSPFIDSKYGSPICPHCGGHDIFVCKNCKHEYKRYEDAPHHSCECGGMLDRIKYTSGQFMREKRWIEYCLGYQQLINGINHKIILRIKENGNCVIT